MNDDCLLGVDFLKKVNLQNVFESTFGLSETSREIDFNCSRIQVSSERIPSFLKELYENSSSNLSESQKDIFAVLLFEHQRDSSGEVTAGNCDVIEHIIDIKLFSYQAGTSPHSFSNAGRS